MSSKRNRKHRFRPGSYIVNNAAEEGDYITWDHGVPLVERRIILRVIKVFDVPAPNHDVEVELLDDQSGAGTRQSSLYRLATDEEVAAVVAMRIAG